MLAGIAAIRSNPHGDRVEVVVATHDIGPATVLTTADLALENHLVATVPDGASTQLGDVLGATLAGPARRGEILTDVRLLGSRLTEAAVGADGRIVPLHPAESALIDLLRPGDVVDVVAAPDTPDSPATARVLATGAVVVLASGRQSRGSEDQVVLVAVPASAAGAVASAALTEKVTLTLR